MIGSRKRRRSAREIKKELRTIYSGVDGKMPDLTRMSHKQKSLLTRFLVKTIAVLFVLSAIAWTGFFLFTRGTFENDETLETKIETADEIKSGEETTFTIRYENRGNIPIASLEMKLNVPDSFHITSSAPQPTEETQWSIGSLTPSSDGAIVIKGIFLSEAPSVQRIQTLFTYKPANFSSNFQKIENKSVEIKSSTVSAAMTGPEKAIAGDQVIYILNIKHAGKDPVFNVRVLPLFPTDFAMLSSEPKLNEGQQYWDIPTLEPNKLVAIKITGSFTSTASGELTIGSRVGFMDEENFFEQAKTQVITDVLGGAIGFHLILNASDKDQTIDVGKILRGSIDYKNPGTEPFEDISFSLSLSSDRKIPINWNKSGLSDGKRTDNIIKWNKETNKQLSKLGAGDEGVIDFVLPISETLSSGQADKFTLALSVSVSKFGSSSGARTISATPIVISINSNTQLSAQARYFSDESVPYGSGDLPPKVGKTTSYRIIWDLSNSMHELNNTEVATILPQDVTWKDVSAKDIGNLTFNSTTRQVRWQIPKLPIDIKNAKAWFDISITPKKQDVGKFVKLTNQTALTAIDSITKTEVNRSLDVLTTELPDDELAKGKGMVIE